MTKRTTAIAALFLLAVGCSLFDDLESEHPFVEQGPDPCEECPEFCVEGECVEFDECARCGPDEECVDGSCQPIQSCDDETNADCPPDPPCDDPDAPECAQYKQCFSGEQIPFSELCSCEQDGQCVCTPETGECVECVANDGERCECNDVVRCPDDAECIDFRCVDQPPPDAPCLAEQPDPDCTPCESGSCPDGYDCMEDEGRCYRSGCTEDPLICVHLCEQDFPCPDGLVCVNELACASQTCSCPMDLTCTIDDPVCREQSGDPIRCDRDSDCEPGYCVEQICVGR